MAIGAHCRKGERHGDGATDLPAAAGVRFAHGFHPRLRNVPFYRSLRERHEKKPPRTERL